MLKFWKHGITTIIRLPGRFGFDKILMPPAALKHSGYR